MYFRDISLRYKIPYLPRACAKIYFIYMRVNKNQLEESELDGHSLHPSIQNGHTIVLVFKLTIICIQVRQALSWMAHILYTFACANFESLLSSFGLRSSWLILPIFENLSWVPFPTNINHFCLFQLTLTVYSSWQSVTRGQARHVWHLSQFISSDLGLSINQLSYWAGVWVGKKI